MQKRWSAASRKRILLVDDDADVRLLLEHVLMAADYVVECARDTSAARGLLAQNDYDLVVTDARLPDGSGFDIADQAIEQGAPALVITGYGLSIAAQTLARYDCLLKPIRPNEMVRAILDRIGPAMAE